MAEFKHIVRIANTDIAGEKPLVISLQKIKGVGYNFSAAICSAAGIPKQKKAGALSDAEAVKLNDILRKPQEAGLPLWMLNRRLDPETSEDKHLIMSDIDFTLDQDKKREMKLKSYKGLRYHARLPVRGQRTRSNHRPNKGKVTLKKRVTVIRK